MKETTEPWIEKGLSAYQASSHSISPAWVAILNASSGRCALDVCGLRLTGTLVPELAKLMFDLAYARGSYVVEVTVRDCASLTFDSQGLFLSYGVVVRLSLVPEDNGRGVWCVV